MTNPEQSDQNGQKPETPWHHKILNRLMDLRVLRETHQVQKFRAQEKLNRRLVRKMQDGTLGAIDRQMGGGLFGGKDKTDPDDVGDIHIGDVTNNSTQSGISSKLGDAAKVLLMGAGLGAPIAGAYWAINHAMNKPPAEAVKAVPYNFGIGKPGNAGEQ